MSNKPTPSTNSSQSNFSLGLQPAPAWAAILGLVLFSTACVFGGAGSILRLAFPVASLAVGGFLYLRYPILYMGFSWWLWFLTPLLRRLIDYRSGWDPQGLILVAPYLVTFACLATFLRHLPSSYRQGSLPFIMAAVGVFYAFLVGLVQYAPASVARALLDWLSPVLLAFHLFVNWRDYPSYRQNIQTVFLWGVLLTGAYGVVQFLVAPEWDRFWLIESKMTSSMGKPEPFGMRVWSTMNSGGPFASFMMAGLLLLFSTQSPWRFPAAAVGFLAFLLTQGRTSWLGWLLGLILTINSVKPQLKMRLIITVFIVAFAVIPLAYMQPFSDIIATRMQTFSNLEDDNSANTRVEIYQTGLEMALSNGLGNGLGNRWVVSDSGKIEGIVLDSGIIDIFLTLGWFGAIPYVGGIILICFSLLRSSEGRFDVFASISRAIGISFFAQLVGYSSQLGFNGLLFWGFLGLGMAANKYYQHQRLDALK